MTNTGTPPRWVASTVRGTSAVVASNIAVSPSSAMAMSARHASTSSGFGALGLGAAHAETRREELLRLGAHRRRDRDPAHDFDGFGHARERSEGPVAARAALRAGSVPSVPEMTSPNVLLIMTDEERYPPPYETEAVARFRREQLGARESLRAGGLEFHRHYAGSTACTPSRATLFTGQYPSLHGVSQTDGLAKRHTDPDMQWLDPDGVPTLGDWFRAGGYRTQYRGKWHVSHAELPIPGAHDGLMTSDADGQVLADAVDAYRRADRLDPFGFSGWIGREPHGANKSDCGALRDPVFAEQVVGMFDDLARARDDGAWLAVASFVNPHDIAFTGAFWDAILEFAPPDDTVPEIPEAPSQSDSFAGRPPCQEQFREVWPQMVYAQATDLAYRRLYYYLHKLVDRAIARVLEALDASGMADDTIVVFTSDHGDLLGAHGGMMQKWYNAYDEAIRVPLVVKGAGVAPRPDGVDRADVTRRPGADPPRPRGHRCRSRGCTRRRSTTTRSGRCPVVT